MSFASCPTETYPSRLRSVIKHDRPGTPLSTLDPDKRRPQEWVDKRAEKDPIVRGQVQEGPSVEVPVSNARDWKDRPRHTEAQIRLIGTQRVKFRKVSFSEKDTNRESPAKGRMT